MKRREFITMLGGATAWPFTARAQQPAGSIRRVAVLMGIDETTSSRSWLAALVNRLDELGWREGRNFVVQQWWHDPPEQMRLWVAKLMARSPDVIVTFTNLALDMLKPMAGGVPIVFSGVGDPVGSGFVTSLARPGGNLTGFASHEPSLGGKWLDLLKETAPHVRRVLAIMHAETPAHQAMWQSIEAAAPRLEIEVTAGSVHDAGEIERVIASFAQKPNGGLMALPHALTNVHAPTIIALAQRYQLPATYAVPEHVAAGGLISYGISWEDQFRGAAEYVDRILNGEKPADLPVQNPTRFKLVVNLKTAKALGLNIPETVLGRADEVIE